MMIKQYLEEIKNNKNIRENLSLLRADIKQQSTSAAAVAADADLFVRLLEDEDPKIRKNAALLLGELKLQQALAPLFCAYRNEKIRFVKSAYLTAMQKLDASAYKKELKEIYQALGEIEPAEDEKKHIAEEMQALGKLIDALEGIKRHTFTDFISPGRLVLATNKEQREVTLEEIKKMSDPVRKTAKLHPLGVIVMTDKVMPFTRLRTYRELLLPFGVKTEIPKEPKQAARILWEAGILPFLQQMHGQKGDVFYFRLDLKSRMAKDKISGFSKKFGLELETISKRSLINAPGSYEVEIRLIEKTEGAFAPFLKLSTIPMRRFAYRRHAIASSIHPALAAMLVHLSVPYLKENARVLDPFCGVGTMLIERDICVPAGELYGIDIFGEAIVSARENAAAAGEQIQFIHRDYFDFTYSQRFDEIITNMPVRVKKSKEETDRFYADFIRKSKEVLKPGGVMIVYSNESGFIKKQLRLQGGYKLLREFVIREKDQFHLFVLETMD